MNLKNNEFVVSLASHTDMDDIPYLFAVTNFGRLFLFKDGDKWVLVVDNG